MPQRESKYLFRTIPLYSRKSGKPVFYPALFLAAIVLTVTMICLSILIRKIEASDNLAFDLASFEFLDAHRTKFLTRLFLFVTFMGTGTFLIPMYILLTGYCIYLKKQEQAGTITLVAFSSVLLGWALKPVFHRARPLQPLVTGAGGTSFPSGHALGAFTFAFLIMYLVWQSGRPMLVKLLMSLLSFVFCVSVGISRVYFHVHFASDVTGSLLIAIEWCSVLYIIMTQTRRQYNQWS